MDFISHTLFQDSTLFLTATNNFFDIARLAFFNGLTLSFSLSPPFLIAFRTLVFQGFFAGLASYLGIAFGLFILISLVYSGCLPFIDFWYSLEPYFFLVGFGVSFILLFNYYNKTLSFDKTRQYIPASDVLNLIKIASVQFLLIVCNPPLANFHLVSFPIVVSSFPFLFLVFFSLSFLSVTFLCHSFLLISLNQLSKFVTYVPVKGSIFQTKSPFANTVNEVICILTSILLITSFTQYQWRLFFQYNPHSFNLPVSRKFHLDYKIDFNKFRGFDRLDLGVKNPLRQNINVNYPSPVSSAFDSGTINTYPLYLYSPIQLAENPRVRYLIQLNNLENADTDSLLLGEQVIKHKGSTTASLLDQDLFVSSKRPVQYMVDRKGRNRKPTTQSPIGLGELDNFVKATFRGRNYTNSERLRTLFRVYTRYSLNPIQKLQDYALDSQLSLQQPRSEKRQSPNILKLQKLEGELLYQLAISEIAGSSLLLDSGFPQLPSVDFDVKNLQFSSVLSDKKMSFDPNLQLLSDANHYVIPLTSSKENNDKSNHPYLHLDLVS